MAQQLLRHKSDSMVDFTVPISSASNGAGQSRGSEQTPLGKHYIRAKIGDGLPLNSVMVGRRPTGEIYSPELAQAFPNRDWILTRILWLCGTEPGVNRLGDVDSMARYIYIHGTPDTEPMGVPKSHGCIRLRNQDLVMLYDRVSVGESVIISNSTL
nr:L,D-transpeptidase [Aestuariirhabdus haliotis]